MAERAAEVRDLLKTPAHPAPLMIICTLVAVGELETEVGIHQPNLLQQLRVVREAGIVQPRRASKQIFYRLTDVKTAQLRAALHDLLR